MYQNLQDEGYFKPSVYHTLYRILEVITCVCLMSYFKGHAQESNLARFMTVVFLIISAGRVGFLTHEVGHKSLTGSGKFDQFLEAIVFGISFYL